MEETTQLPKKIENQGIVYQDRNQIVEKIIVKFEDFKKEFFVARARRETRMSLWKGNLCLSLEQSRKSLPHSFLRFYLHRESSVIGAPRRSFIRLFQIA